MRIELNGCVVRSWRAGDEAALAQNANNRKVWLNLRDVFPHPYTVEDAAKWIQSACAETPELSYAIDVGGMAAGGIGITLLTDVERCTADIAYWLGEPYWGRGIVTQVVAAVSEYAFVTLDISRLQAWVFAWNTASMRVLEKCGYVREAVMRKSAIKDGQLINRMLYARLRDP
mgnify:CR=1 FL=1